MPSEQWYLFRQPPLLVDGYNSKSTSSAGFPVDGDVMRVCLLTSDAEPIESGRPRYLYEVGIPCILRDSDIIVALLLPRDKLP